jgi:Aspartyl protease
MRSSRFLPLILLGVVEGALWGEMSIRVLDGRPVVDGVYVNGRGPYRFLVDTGATMNHLEAGLARKAGLRPTFQTELISSLGTVRVPGSDRMTVALGELQAEEQPFLFAGMEVVHGLSADIQGILGQAFLSRFDYLIDLRGKRLVFGKQEEAGGKRAQIQTLGGRTVVATSLGDLALDSGAARLVLFGVEAASGGQDLMHTLAGSQSVGTIQSRLTIEGRRVWAGQAVAIPNRREPGVAGLLPVRLFRAVYVCNSEAYLVFR